MVILTEYELLKTVKNLFLVKSTEQIPCPVETGHWMASAAGSAKYINGLGDQIVSSFAGSVVNTVNGYITNFRISSSRTNVTAAIASRLS
ncbi:MAG: hypothetical protein VR67_16710 [Peptococcaceae bacterium BRH_c8a]|nr:MAG: hypothetical protein VR67_16710 [Peptococcaceae bacterium BRH_c8a]